jgi:hypothetical protein
MMGMGVIDANTGRRPTELPMINRDPAGFICADGPDRREWAPDPGAVGIAWGRSCVVRRQPRRLLY